LFLNQMNIKNGTSEIKEIMIRSGDTESCERVFELSQSLCLAENVLMTDVQQLALLSHLSAMVHRSLSGEKLVPIDRELFSEVSSESLQISKQLKDALPNLDEDEVYLLSIHFEVAKQNSVKTEE
jgi:PRD domain protein (TIGR03582 family)